MTVWHPWVVASFRLGQDAASSSDHNAEKVIKTTREDIRYICNLISSGGANDDMLESGANQKSGFIVMSRARAGLIEVVAKHDCWPRSTCCFINNVVRVISLQFQHW